MIDESEMHDMAAEYVLGTLDAEERREVENTRPLSMALDGAIQAWERRLSPLVEDLPEVAPSPGLFAKIERRIARQPSIVYMADRMMIERRATGWRAFALAMSLALIVMTGVAVSTELRAQRGPGYVALLQKDAAAPAFLANLDDRDLTLTVRTLGAAPPADKSYQLWLLAGAAAPKSLGVLPSQTIQRVKLTGIDRAIARTATLAVSLEPLGGSPTGAPTGPVVFAGKFARANL